MVTVDEVLFASLGGSTLHPQEEARIRSALGKVREWPTPGTASLVEVGGECSAVLVGVRDRPFMLVVLSPIRAEGVLSETLTKREREVAKLAGARLDNATIARVLEISPDTVQSHMKEINRKQGRGTWHRPSARGDDVAASVQRFNHAERDLLAKLAVSPLVGALARHAGIAPRQCRARLDSIARKVQGGERNQQPRRRTHRASR